MANPQNPSGNGTHSEQPFGERIDHLNSSARDLISDARSAVHDLSASIDLKGRVERNPYAMLAAAAGVGYVLGGGLFTPLTARVLRLGMRLAALPLVKDELVGLAEAALDGFVQGTGSGSGSSGPTGPVV